MKKVFFLDEKVLKTCTDRILKILQENTKSTAEAKAVLEKIWLDIFFENKYLKGDVYKVKQNKSLQEVVQEIDNELSALKKDVIKAEREHKYLYFITADIFRQVLLENWISQAKLKINSLEKVKNALSGIKHED